MGLLEDLTWKGPTEVNQYNEMVDKVVAWMTSADSLEEFIAKYGIDPDAFREHVETKIKAIKDRWEADDDPEALDMDGMYILGVLVGTMLEREKKAVD